MTRDDRRMLILFLETFKQELLAVAETFRGRMLRRSELDNIFAFKIASKENKDVVNEMVNEVVSEKGNDPYIGQEELLSDSVNQVSNDNEGKNMGHAKTYASNHFHSDRNAA